MDRRDRLAYPEEPKGEEAMTEEIKLRVATDVKERSLELAVEALRAGSSITPGKVAGSTEIVETAMKFAAFLQTEYVTLRKTT